jgi:hypothetical protein
VEILLGEPFLWRYYFGSPSSEDIIGGDLLVEILLGKPIQWRSY